MSGDRVNKTGATKRTKIQVMKLQTIIHILISIACVTFLTQMHAVSPPPDGCYPNFTTAEGCKALQSLTTGAGNTGVGWYALFGTTSGSNNTAVGAGALDLNTADNNTAVGVAALLLNTTGINNTANGVGALVFNNTAEENTATGAFAMYSNTEGDFNTANGAFALFSNTTSERNTATGYSALYSNTDGSRNTANGVVTLLNNTTGSFNTAVGAGALFNSTTADNNSALGNAALNNNITGFANTAVGSSALQSNETGADNTAIGYGALADNIGGDFGAGGSNTAVGNIALQVNTTGYSNTALGTGAGGSVTTANNVICIGAGVSGENVNQSCYIGNIFQQTGGSQAVYVNAQGKLGALVSSQRFKNEIKRMEEASEVIYDLKPVSFRYKPDIEPSRPLAFGLIAEEVEEVSPDLVSRDKEGKPYSVRYDQVNAMVLNEFLKEHKKVQDLESRLAQQEHQIDCLSAGLQKVSAQLEMSRPAPEVIANNQ